MAYNAPEMHFSVTRLDMVYEGRFAQPSLDFALDPRAVIKSLVTSVSSRFAIASKDITLWPSQRASEVRLRVTLFNGQGTFEVDADKIGVSFENARMKDDPITIRECLKLGLDGITQALKNDRIADHTIRAMMYLKLLDAPTDGRVFLSSLMSPRNDGLAEKAPTGATFTPALKFELDNPENKWLYVFELSRAYRDREEVFASCTLNCFDGNSFATVEERYSLLEHLLEVTWRQIGLQLPDSK